MKITRNIKLEKPHNIKIVFDDFEYTFSRSNTGQCLEYSVKFQGKEIENVRDVFFIEDCYNPRTLEFRYEEEVN